MREGQTTLEPLVISGIRTGEAMQLVADVLRRAEQIRGLPQDSLQARLGNVTGSAVVTGPATVVGMIDVDSGRRSEEDPDEIQEAEGNLPPPSGAHHVPGRTSTPAQGRVKTMPKVVAIGEAPPGVPIAARIVLGETVEAAEPGSATLMSNGAKAMAMPLDTLLAQLSTATALTMEREPVDRQTETLLRGIREALTDL